MPTDLICPDCGGIIGATKASPAGKPCTCVIIQTFSPSSETVDENPAADERLMHGKPKVCCNCGKDLTGHRRFKDSVGYWCKDCHRADKARNKAHETKCPECGHMKAINSLQDFDGRKVCFNCFRELQARSKKEFNKKVSYQVHRSYETSRVLVLVGVFVVLIVLIVMRKFLFH